MPGGDRPRLARMQRRIRKDLAGAADQPRPGAAPATALFFAMDEIFSDDRRVLIGGWRRLVIRKEIDAGLVAALIKRDLQPARHQPLLHVAAAAAGRADADQVD